MNIVNTHERLISRPLAEIFADLVALGTATDRIWPEPTMAFRRTAGPMRVGVTEEQHGAIHATLAAYVEHRCIVWRVEMGFLRGTHAFDVQETGDGCTRVRHRIQGTLAWWFAPLWHLYIARLHDRILEQLLDRLAECNVTRDGAM